ncbi:MAG TPA: transglycosylase domain-containing protein, partial [Thermoanaerobaculia bacterium]|nr:transglycosylase domain-containing protein [Thermoanaerobaculia bacterium]
MPRPARAASPQPAYVDWRRALGCAGIGALLLLVFGGVGWTRCGIRGCPDVARLGAYQPDGAPLVLDRYGRQVGTLALANRVVVSLTDLPAYVPEAFIAIEDKRFRTHHGVDLRRVVGALFANLRARGIREGSSTLTMQLAGNLFPERISRQQQTLSRKLMEARVAGQIERAYKKDEILELYLNNIYFGGGTRGIEAASQYYFRHPAKQLTLREAALLAALPKAPTHYDPRRAPQSARERRDLVLTLMERQGRIDHGRAAAARAASLGVSRRGRKLVADEPFAGWFLEEVRREVEERFGDALYRQRVRIVTTLDARAQGAAERELDAQLRRIEAGAWGRFAGPRYTTARMGDEEGTDYLQGAVVFMEARTGDVLTWVGGRDYRHSHFDRVEQASRQVGSAFKPFVYASAIAAGIPPTQRLSDEPFEMRFAGGEVWRPRNFGDSYLPSVTLRDALVQSRNVATVRLAESVGMQRIADLAEDDGMPDVPLQPSSALGASSATPLELTRAYTAF